MTAWRLYGIPNCDTVKRARAWLAEQGAAVEFIDFKKAGAAPASLQAWCQRLGWEQVLNRRGNTWRQLDAAAQSAVVDVSTACALMQAQPSTIKRPVVEWPDGEITVGFSPEAWADRLAASKR